MKKVLLVQKSLSPPGGGNAVAVWIVEALRRHYRVYVLTWDSVDWASVNRYYGTSLRPGDVEVIRPRLHWRLMAACVPDPHQIQRLGVLLRTCRTIGGRYDAIIGADNEMDFGRPGIQYFHYPCLEELHRFESPAPLRGFDAWRARLKYRWRPWRLVSGFSFQRMKQNVSLVNSDWTGEAVHRLYGIRTRTVYPPIAGEFRPVDWSERKNHFAAVGRIVVEKRLETVIDIVARVRERFPEVELVILGTPGSRRHDRAYFDAFKKRVAPLGWVTIVENLPRDRLLGTLSQCRYGIHGLVDEHFGMGVAELASAGCIPFVPDGGGQREIVGRHSGLTFGSVDDAVESICAMMSSESEQRAAREALASASRRFTPERFAGAVRSMVDEIASGGGVAGPDATANDGRPGHGR